jgi:hypothetical protein
VNAITLTLNSKLALSSLNLPVTTTDKHTKFNFNFFKFVLFSLSLVGSVKLRNVAFCSATPETIYQKEIKKSEVEEEDTNKRQQQTTQNGSSQQIPRSSPISSFVQKGLSGMGNSNYEHINRYLKQQQILVAPTM